MLHLSKMSNNSSSDGLPTAKVAPLVGVNHRTPNHKPAKAVGGSSPAKENKLMALLEARSQVIEKQKLTISRLQKECKDKDDLISTQSSLNKTSGNETAISLPVRIDILSRKLDEANCELDVTKSNNKSLQDKLSEKDLQIIELEKEISDLKMANESSEKKIVKLEAYLKNVPTMEEHYSLKEQKTQLNSTCNNLKLSLREKEEEIISLKSKLTDIETTLNERSVELTRTKHENETLLAKCETNNDRFVQLQSENSLFKMDVQKLQKTLRDLERQSRQDLKDMRERHRQRFNEATAKLKEQYKAVMKRNRQLEMQLLKSNDVITALDNEVKISYDRESHYKSSMAELVAQNQSLLERNLAVPDPLEELKTAAACSPVSDISDDSPLLQLNHEITLCIGEIESLIDLASSILEGTDPNISTLLGVTDRGHRACNVSLVNDDVESCNKKYEQLILHIQRKRNEIDKMREAISDKFASHVANECHIQ